MMPFHGAFLFYYYCLVRFDFVSPEFSYRPGLSVLSEDTNNAASTHGAGGPPNRPLPPTPDDDDQQGDRTLIMKRVSYSKFNFVNENNEICGFSLEENGIKIISFFFLSF